MEEKTYSQMRREFQELYFKKISPEIAKFDKERKQKLALAITLAIIFSLLATFILIIFIYPENRIDKGTAKFITALYVIAVVQWSIIKKDFEDKIKSKVMQKICECFGNLQWEKNKYFAHKTLSDSNLIPEYTSIEKDDVLKGEYKGVSYKMVEAEFEIGSGKNRRTVFKGLIVQLSMNKPFKGNTVIRPDSLLHCSPDSLLRHTVLEDVVFEKKFDVYTDDEVEARYLITPSFMERLNNMKVAFSANKVSCAFYKKYLFVALHTSKDLFSICSLVKPVNDIKQFYTMFEEILSIVKLIDYFKLDQKIGL